MPGKARPLIAPPLAPEKTERKRLFSIARSPYRPNARRHGVMVAGGHRSTDFAAGTWSRTAGIEPDTPPATAKLEFVCYLMQRAAPNLLADEFGLSALNGSSPGSRS